MNPPRTKVPARRGFAAVLAQIGAIEVPAAVFHPVSLDVIETPPSPVRVVILWATCALFAAVVAGACWGKVDIYAEAPGRVQSAGRSKVVQPLDPGIVRTIYVQNGSHVKSGEALIDMDPTETAAERDEADRSLQEAAAEVDRRIAAINAARQPGQRIDRLELRDSHVPGAVLARQSAALVADMHALQATLAVFDADIHKSTAQTTALQRVIQAQDEVVRTLRERLAIRRALEKEKWESQANVIDAEEALARAEAEQVDRAGQIATAQADISELRRKQQEAIGKFVDDNNQAEVAAAAKRDTAQQELVKASAKAERKRLTAPISGTVQELAVTTLGQVVTPGQQLMTIVPDKAPVEIEALVANRDIGFVAVGQTAVVKVDTFPYTLYGTLTGLVARVSRDAVDVDAQEALPTADETASGVLASRSGAAATPRTHNLVFPITVSLDSAALPVNGKPVPLSPGMTVVVEVVTGKRRIIDFLLAPLREVSTQAARER